MDTLYATQRRLKKNGAYFHSLSRRVKYNIDSVAINVLSGQTNGVQFQIR